MSIQEKNTESLKLCSKPSSETHGQLVWVRETRKCGKKTRHRKVEAIERCPHLNTAFWLGRKVLCILFVLFCPIGVLQVYNPLCVLQYKVHTQNQFAPYLACVRQDFARFSACAIHGRESRKVDILLEHTKWAADLQDAD